MVAWPVIARPTLGSRKLGPRDRRAHRRLCGPWSLLARPTDAGPVHVRLWPACDAEAERTGEMQHKGRGRLAVADINQAHARSGVEKPAAHRSSVALVMLVACEGLTAGRCQRARSP